MISSPHASSGFEAVRRVVASYWPDRVERITGVPARKIVEAAHILGEAATAMVLTGRGPEQQSHGVNNVLAFINLTLALGKAGKPFCGYGCLTGQGNGQGGREHGQKADQLPGYRRLDDPAHRAEIAAVWGIDPAGFAEARPLGLRNVRAARATAYVVCWWSRRTSSSRRPRPLRFASDWIVSTCSWSPICFSPKPPRTPTSCCPSPSGRRKKAP